MREKRSMYTRLAALIITVALTLPTAASRADAQPLGGPAASARQPHTYTFIIVARHSGKCLEVSDASVADGANVDQWTCTGSTNQQWSFYYVNDNEYLMVARHSGKCLQVSDASVADGANVDQWTCDGRANQLWSFYHVGSNNYLAVARHSGKCLEVAGASVVDGANVDQRTCDGSANQQWRLGS
ncbi:RICIN domain-containing protein [Kutzneria kofuensis]|uniref:Ricin B lectin domain-containing protein n=1 Tax=Kutzneria kofuensis TaxID=103725 RepID=A0A7W9KKY9_9PSEU|nr:RICIN domain-containing protein [Kutzneria kofuensis]MBB5894370.1 hypothetical protein [Kutzneria kofuensis]